MEELTIKDKFLLTGAVIVAIAGCIILLIISRIYQERLPSNVLLTLTEEGETVKMSGLIGKITTANNTLFLRLKTETFVDATVFKTNTLDIKEGDRITMIGKVNTYKGKKSIIVDEIERTG